MISSLLLLLILAIIIVSNLTNNPFSKVTYDKEIREIEDMVKSKIEDGVEMSPEMKNKLNQLLRERDLNRGKTPVAQQALQALQANTIKPPQVSNAQVSNAQVSNAQVSNTQVSTNKANTPQNPQASPQNPQASPQNPQASTETEKTTNTPQAPQAPQQTSQAPPQAPQAQEQANTTNIPPQASTETPQAQAESKGESKIKMSGGTADLQRTLELLQNREIEIGTRISMLKSNATFNYTSLSFCIIIFSFYISYKMIMSSVHFNDNLFSGAAFMKSRCYSN
tara:strand:- start:952 stop:1794 length:843 start_codon:yes stop_codon:yes gene_type:complete